MANETTYQTNEVTKMTKMTKTGLKAARIDGIKFRHTPGSYYTMTKWGVMASDGTWLSLSSKGLVSAWRTKKTAATIAATIIQDDLTEDQWLQPLPASHSVSKPVNG